MNLFFTFDSSWYVLFFGFLLPWAVLLFVRRKISKPKEFREQGFLALCGIIALGLMESFAVSTNLWHYTPGDWPVILWPTYLAAILFGYQLLRSIEGIVRNKDFLIKNNFS
jgi:hypothetical protein